MYRFTALQSRLLVAVTLVAAFMAAHASANGEIGEHVNDLKAHIDEYTDEVHWLIQQTDSIVATYADKGAAAAEPAKLVDHWEAVKVHGAIETTYVPIYASIWQGIIGVQQAIQQNKSVAEVKTQQAALEQALWQGLGAVKLAAEQQSGKATAAVAPSAGASPTATVDEIKANLDKVMAMYTQKKFAEAKSLVHATYANRFEGIEGMLIEQEAALVEELEMDFNVALPQALDDTTSSDAVRKIINAMKDKLDRTKTLLAKAEQERKDVF